MKNIKLLSASILAALIFNPILGIAAPKKETPKTELDSKSPELAATPKSQNAATAMFDKSMSKLPTFIKSDNLSLKSETRTFTYSGNVEVTQGDMTLTSQSMDGHYDENNKIQQLVAKGSVLITKGPLIRATGERAIYEAATETVVLTENPELQQDGSILSADRIRIYLNENRSVAEGTVRVKLIQKDQAAVDTSSVLKKQK